jgi:hypothetical protein
MIRLITCRPVELHGDIADAQSDSANQSVHRPPAEGVANQLRHDVPPQVRRPRTSATPDSAPVKNRTGGGPFPAGVPPG